MHLWRRVHAPWICAPARRATLATLALALVVPTRAEAQVRVRTAPGDWVGAPVEEYVRLLQLTGVMPLASRMIRPVSVTERWVAPDSAPWRAPWSARYRGDQRTSQETDTAALGGWRPTVTVFEPVSQTTYNSAFPFGWNDGAMWAGRGLSTQLTAGAALRAGPLRAQLVPTVWWSENRSFDMAPLRGATATASPFADAWYSRYIDLPQRFGTGSFARLDPGQSSISVDAYGARAGYGTENMWWGPGIDNTLLQTNAGPGFRHAFLGTSKPANVWIGRIEVLYSLGWLDESGYWSTTPLGQDRRWLNSLAVVFEPRGMPGLYLGGARTFVALLDSNPITFREIRQILQSLEKKNFADTISNPGGDDRRNQMASLWLRWLLPEAGFEFYAEYGRNDHSWDGRDLALEPEHSAAYQLGLQKVWRVRDGVLAGRAEVTNLTRSITGMLRPTPTWYVHHRVLEGYTERGQLIGAGVGPGGDMQTIAFDWFEPRGRAGFLLQRRRINTDVLLSPPITIADRLAHDTFLEGGPRLTLFTGRVDVDVSYMLQYEYNRHMVIGQDARNHHFDLRLQSRLP